MYKIKYLNTKYGGAYDEVIELQQTTIKIVTISGEIIGEFPTENFTIDSLITSSELDFYNSIFELLHNEDRVYSDNDTFELNDRRILAFPRQMHTK
jgi:hypothetical protein